MSSFEYTEKQKQAVEWRHQDLLVHAGAGSGKTKVLVGRFFDLVVRDGLTPSQIMTITFTEKAAQEMKDRLRRLFLERNLRGLWRQVNHAYISTIHAFCSRLLRENALEARIDPSFIVMEEYEAYRLKKACLREVLNQQTLLSAENFLNFILEAASSDLEKDLLKLYHQARGKGLTQFSFAPVSPALANHRSVVSKILSDLDRVYGDYKEQRAWLDFADLELKVKKLLEEHQDLREELKRKWPFILLDELQDTNPLQLAIINLLRTPGQFFAVGDPHQSIYGFRFADLKAYEELQREVGRRGKIMTLDKNFRSRQPLLQLVDYCFNPLWPQGTTFPHIKMDAGQEGIFAEKAIPSIEAVIFTSPKKETGRNFEADTLCRRIYELVSQEKLPVYDKEQKIIRPLEFGDCAILLRKTTHVKTWERALQKYRIPYQVVRSRGFFGTPEVADLLNFLKVLENPLDDLALASFLRSSLVGISEDTLFLLAQKSKSNGQKSLCSALREKDISSDPGEQEKLIFAQELLDRMRPAHPQGFYRLLKQGIEESYYPAKTYLYAGGERIRANLRKLMQVAYEMSSLGMDHLRDLLEVADFLRYQQDVMAEGEVAAPQKGRLCLSTIHGAKGLEYPLVAVAELDSQLQTDRDAFSLVGNNILNIKIKDATLGDDSESNSSSTKKKKKTGEEEHLAEREEELRLLYVALTRAQEHLLISGSLKFNKDGKLRANQWINLVEERNPVIASLKEAVEAGEKLTILGGVPIKLYWRALSGEEADPLAEEVGAIHQLPLPAEEIQAREWNQEVEEQGQSLLAQVAKAQGPTDGSHYMVTVSEVVDFFRCPRLYQLKYLWGLRGEGWEEGIGEWEQDNDTVGEGSSRDIGIFVHGILARPDVGAQSRLSGMPLPIPDALKGEESRIRSMLDNFIKSPWKQAMEKARQVDRELPFVVKLKDGLLRGQVDVLIFDDSSNYLLLDYKTGKTAEEDKDYQLQLKLYALALGKIYGIEPQKAVLYYLLEGISREVPLEQKGLEEAELWVEKLFEAQKQQKFAYKKEYCFVCRQRKLCEQKGEL